MRFCAISLLCNIFFVPLEFKLCFCLHLSLSHCLFCVLQPCGHLLGKDWPHGSPVCDVLLCICHFPIWCPGSGVIPDLCLSPYFVVNHLNAQAES